MIKLSNTEAEPKKCVAYKKEACNSLLTAEGFILSSFNSNSKIAKKS